MRPSPTHLVGVVSDTHGLIRPGVLDALHGVEHIVHAGDVGDAAILETLRGIAPVTAVRGNVDRDPWCRRLPPTAEIEVGGVWIHVLHDREDLALDPRAARFGVVVSGHSHRPEVVTKGGVLYLNPGSCGPRRFKLPVTLARLAITDGAPSAEIVRLAAEGAS